jgi:hypothetical protein
MTHSNRVTLLAAVVLVASASASDSGAKPSAVETFFEKHCYECHSGEKPEAGLDLATASRDLADPAAMARFVRIHDRVAKGEMPPEDSPRPAAEELKPFLAGLDKQLFDADAARIGRHGRARMRRMTAAEYENTLRDLLAIDHLEVSDLLPPDGSVAGFDKVAEALDLSPVHVTAYAAAAERALDTAIAIRSDAPPVYKERIYPATRYGIQGQMVDNHGVLLKDMRHDPAQPLPAATPPEPPGLNHDQKFNRTHELRDARVAAYKANGVFESKSAFGMLGHPSLGVAGASRLGVSPVYPGRYRIAVSLWGFLWNKGDVEPVEPQAAKLWSYYYNSDNGRPLGTFTALSLKPTVHEIVAWLEPREELVLDPISLRYRTGSIILDYTGPGVAYDWYEIEGPINEIWPPESHRRLFGDLPIAPLPADAKVIPPARSFTFGQVIHRIPTPDKDFPKSEQKRPLETVQSSAPLDDARQLLAAFLPRAFRRPVNEAAVESYVALVAARLAANDCFEDAMRRAYVAVLTSPQFLFHRGDDRCDQYAMASRLSYWLWNSPPDEPLLAAAAAGTLSDPAVIRGQVDRLLVDPRSERFIVDFTDQWLELRRMNETLPDRLLYPEYRMPLHDGMIAEPRAFLRELIAKDLPITSLVDADFAMLNQRLAEHYGVPGIDGVEIRRVSLPPGTHRGGLLTQASILKVTANGTTTSPVKRGVWLMDRLLDEPPPPPPPGVPGIDADTRGATTIREQLALHSTNASCAVCHVKIDPPGLALEAFDPIGGFRDRYRTSGGDATPADAIEKWRATYRLGPKVDASGRLADGRSFQGIDDFKKMLAENPQSLARAFVAHLARYASGANISYADRRAIDAIVESTAANGYGLRSLIHAVAVSPLVAAPTAIVGSSR